MDAFLSSNEALLQSAENEATNLTYDLAEGPHATLKGSMNEALEHAPAGYEGMLLSLMQRTAEHRSATHHSNSED